MELSNIDWVGTIKSIIIGVVITLIVLNWYVQRIERLLSEKNEKQSQSEIQNNQLLSQLTSKIDAISHTLDTHRELQNMQDIFSLNHSVEQLGENIELRIQSLGGILRDTLKEERVRILENLDQSFMRLNEQTIASIHESLKYELLQTNLSISEVDLNNILNNVLSSTTQSVDQAMQRRFDDIKQGISTGFDNTVQNVTTSIFLAADQQMHISQDILERFNQTHDLSSITEANNEIKQVAQIYLKTYVESLEASSKNEIDSLIPRMSHILRQQLFEYIENDEINDVADELANKLLRFNFSAIEKFQREKLKQAFQEPLAE